MKLILDEREDDLYDKCHHMIYEEEPKLQKTLQLSKRVLELGDALITTEDDKPVLLIERKCFNDLLASIKDGRYEEQSYRITHTCDLHLHNVIYVLEGVFSQLRSVQDKKLVYSALTSLNYFKGFSVMKTSSVRETAELIIYAADKIARDIAKGKIPAYKPRTSSSVSQEDKMQSENPDGEEVGEQDGIINPEVSGEGGRGPSSVDYCNVVKKAKKENITKDNIGEIILSQIPGISSTTAISIMKGFHSFPHFMKSISENPELLENIRVENDGKSRKLGKNCIQGIKTFLVDCNQQT